MALRKINCYFTINIDKAVITYANMSDSRTDNPLRAICVN